MRVGPHSDLADEDPVKVSEDTTLGEQVRRALAKSAGEQAVLLARELMPMLNRSIKEMIEETFHEHGFDAQSGVRVPREWTAVDVTSSAGAAETGSLWHCCNMQ